MRRRGRAAALAAALGVAVGLPACADFSAVGSHVCGNAVVDADEDCDTFGTEPGTRCGASDGSNACRLVCGASADATCPIGWGCGLDGVCRRPSGSFAPLGDIVPFASPHAIRAGDFDGDGVLDVLLIGEEDALGRNPARIVYPPSAAAPAIVVALPLEIASPAIGDFEQNGGADLAFARLGGVSVLRGRKDRGVEIRPFPSLVPPRGTSLRALPMDVIPAAPGDEVVHLIDRAEGGATLERPAGAAPGAVLTALPGGEAALAGPPSWGRFDEAAPCPDIALSFTGSTQIYLFSPCRVKLGAVEWNTGGALHGVALPAGSVIDRAALLVDLDLDQHLDLLIGASGQAFVAWGQGDGTFTSAKVNGELGAAGPYALPAAASGGFPLAAADVNGDGVVDFVAPGGLAVSGPGGYALVHHNLGTPWTQAVLIDVNADGRLDVAAGSSEALDVDFLVNAGGGAFNASALATSGPTESFAVGDFDGDLIDDLAFVQQLDGLDGAEDDLTIAFGVSHGAPSIGAVAARLREVEQVVAARLPDALSKDTIADLLVVSQDPSSTTDQLFVFDGGGSRTLTSPLPLAGDVPVAIAAGLFADPTPELAVVGADIATGALHLWLVEQTTSISAESLVPSAPLSPLFHSAAGAQVNFRYAAYAATGDLDGDGVSEVVVVAPYGAASDGAAAVVVRFDAASGALVPGIEQPFTAPLSVDDSLQLLDVDGDGNLDALLTTGSHEAPGDLLVFWNDGSGEMMTASPGRIQIPGGVLDFACLPASDGHGCSLVLVSEQGAWLATAAGSRQFDVTAIPDLAPGRGVVAADFDRNGTIDVAIQTIGGLQFYGSLPVRQ